MGVSAAYGPIFLWIQHPSAQQYSYPQPMQFPMQSNPPGAEPGLGCKGPADPWMAHGTPRGPARQGLFQLLAGAMLLLKLPQLQCFPKTQGCCDAASCLSYPKSKAFCTAPLYSL